MPIDASIAMGYQPIKLDNPMNQLAQIMQIENAQKQNRLADFTMQTQQQAFDENNKLNALYSGAIKADGTIDRAKLLSGAASGGLGSKIPGLQKGFLDADESQGKVDKQKVDLIDAKLKQSRGFLEGITTPEQYIAWQEGNHKDPVLGPELARRGVTAEQARASIGEALQQPGGLQRLLQQSALGIEKFTEMNKPSYQTRNTGDRTTILAMPGLGGAPTEVSSAAINQSADSRASERSAAAGRQVTMRGQDMTNARSIESNRIAAENKADKPLTEGQSKSALFGSRMEMANKIFDTLETSGTTTSTPGMNSGYGIGNVVSALSSADQQQLMQAKRDFLNAVLRRESGAVIGESEFANGEKQYFPQVGDSKQVKAQKKANREAATRGVLVDVPSGRRGEVMREITGSGQPPTANGGFKYLGTE